MLMSDGSGLPDRAAPGLAGGVVNRLVTGPRRSIDGASAGALSASTPNMAAPTDPAPIAASPANRRPRSSLWSALWTKSFWT